jgi:hypothetical protein
VDGGFAPPLLCLPELVRPEEDFAASARLIGAGPRVVPPDYAGR